MHKGNARPFAPHRFLRLALLLFQLGWPATSLDAQTETLYESWRWVHFSTGSGLPDNDIYSVTESPNGTAWASTRQGIAWYDGYRWRSIAQAHGAPTSPATIILPYGQEEILALMGNRLYRGSRETMTAVSFKLEGNEENIFSIVPLEDFLVLLYTRKGLWTYDGRNFHPFHLPQEDELLSDGNPNLWKTEKGDVWLNTTKGLYRLQQTSWIRVLQYGEFYFAIKSIVQNKEGIGIASIALPADEQGLWEWRGNGVPVRSTTERLSLVQSIDFNQNGNPVVAYESGEVRIRSNGTWKNFSPLPPQMTNI